MGNEESFAHRLVCGLTGNTAATSQLKFIAEPASEPLRQPPNRKTMKVLAGDLPVYKTESFTGLQHALRDLLWRAAHPQQARDLVPHVSHDARTVYAALKSLAESGDLNCTTVRGTRIDRFSASGKRRGWFSESEQRLVSERELAVRGVHSRDTIKYRLGRGTPADEAASEPLQTTKSHPRKTSKSATQTATQESAWVANSGSESTIRSSPVTVDKEIDTGRSPLAPTSTSWKEKRRESSLWHEKHLKAVADRRHQEVLDERGEGVHEEERTQPGRDSILGPSRPDLEFLRSLGIIPAGEKAKPVAQAERKVGIVHMSTLDNDDEVTSTRVMR